MASTLISRDMPLPEILSRYPSCRPVFDRYGLHGCGGELGPQEPLHFFARAHRVDEARLMAELEEAARCGALAPGAVEYHPGPADTIYRKFFKAAILVMFTFGCVLGGLNLAVMAMRHQLATLDLRAVTWAHAHAQVAGWVTFFVMGFAYQALPRFKFVALWKPRLAVATLYAQGAALAVRAVADLFLPSPAWALAGTIAGAMELAVVLTFVAIVARSVRASQQPTEPWERWVYSALAWMVAAFAFDLWMFHTTATVSGDQNWVRFISRYDAPWRDLQLAGFAATMILGVSQRFLPFIYGFREVPARTSRRLLWLWNAAVAGNVVGYSLLIRTFNPLWGLLLEASILAMLATVALLARGFGLFSMRVEGDRSLPFLKAAYFWAVVALALFALLPVYDALIGVPFSHAYFGGYRHAFTVGFISLMIVGVSSKVVPVLGGLDAARLNSLWASFWLINIGNGMRVLFQILTDTQHWAYPLMGASAWVEITGLSLWAIDLWRTMGRQPEGSRRAARGLSAQSNVSEVVDRYPETLPVFSQFGFTMLTNPMARRLMAHSVTLEQACRLKHADCQALLAALERTIAREADACAPPAAADGLIQIS